MNVFLGCRPTILACCLS